MKKNEDGLTSVPFGIGSKAIKVVVFLILGFCIFQKVCFVFAPSEIGTLQMRYLSIVKQHSIDVVILGSSHAYCGIDPALLWQEQGIASMVAGSGAQPAYSTYFRLLELLKTQTPELVIIDLYAFAMPPESPPRLVVHVWNNIGWSFSQNKLDMFRESFKDASWTLYLDFFLELPTYHSRYNRLSSDNFFRNYDLYGKGYYSETRVRPVRPLNILPVTAVAEPHPVNLSYFNKILNLARERNFELLFIALPSSREAAELQKRYNYYASISGKNGYAMLNFCVNFQNAAFNVKTDFRDAEHLNTSGAIKASKYLSQYLKSNYTLPDRREDLEYMEWDVWAKNMRSRYIESFKKANPKISLD